MTTGIKGAILKAAGVSGLYSVVRKWKPSPIILLYHGVEERIVDARVQSLHLPLNVFEKQIAYLRGHFEIISLDDLYNSVSTGRQLHSSQVVLTFDDGYKNNRTIIAPYLKANNIPFAVFVSTRHVSEGLRFSSYYLRASIFYTSRRHAKVLNEEFNIGTHAGKMSALAAISKTLKNSPHEIANQIIADLVQLIPQDQWAELNELFSSDQPMNWGDVKQLHSDGVQVGSHCHDHFILHRRQNIEEVGRQIHMSRTLIQQHLGDCKFIAYPNGKMQDIAPVALERVKSEEYLAGLTTVAGEIDIKTNPYLLPRVSAETQDIYRFMFTVNLGFRRKSS